MAGSLEARVDVARVDRARVDLACVGDGMIDVSVESPVLARGGDVHGHVFVHPGGSAANAAVWAAHEGFSSRTCGRVGNDLGGRLLTEALRERGVDPVLAMDPAAATGAMLVVHEAGERSMVADRGANANITPADLPEPIAAGAVLVSGYLLLHESSHEAALAAIEHADAPHVAVDAASWPLIEAFGATRFLHAATAANVVLANEREAAALTGAQAEGALAALTDHFEVVGLKLGPRGAILAIDGRTYEGAAPEVEPVDPTGAGDAFDGVLLGALVRGDPPEEALAAACRAGALVAASPEPWPQS